MDIVSRVKNIISTPKTEWPVISIEPTQPATLYTSYVIPLAAIPAICMFLGLIIFGVPTPIGTFRPSIGTALSGAIVQFVFALIGVGLMGLIFSKLAPNFGGVDDINQGLKLAAYSATPGWIGGILGIIPAIAWIGALFGLYGLYLLWLGIPVLMKTPRERTLVYVIVAIIVAIVVALILGWLRITLLGV